MIFDDFLKLVQSDMLMQSMSKCLKWPHAVFIASLMETHDRLIYLFVSYLIVTFTHNYNSLSYSFCSLYGRTVFVLQCRKLKDKLAATEAQLNTLQNGKHISQYSTAVFI